MGRHVQADFVHQAHWPHGHPECEHGIVDFVHMVARHPQACGFHEVRDENAVHEEAGRILAEDGPFAYAAGKPEQGSDDLRIGVGASDDLHQFHPVDGVEEMQAAQSTLVLHGHAHRVDGQGRGIGGEGHAVGPPLLKVGKERTLGPDAFHDSLDHEVTLTQRDLFGDGRDPVHGGPSLYSGKDAS